MIRRALTVALAVPVLALAPLAAQAQGASVQPTAAPAPVWTIDKSHSELSFSIRHIVSRVRGTFRDWSGTLMIPDPANWERGSSVDVTIRTASIFTDNEKRDAHLRTSDFFLADSFPAITFRSSRIERSGDDAKIHGTLTMRGVSKPVVLEGKFLGAQGAGFQRVGFEASTTINRLDYGVAWNRALEGGGVTLGDDVEIQIVVSAIRRR